MSNEIEEEREPLIDRGRRVANTKEPSLSERRVLTIKIADKYKNWIAFGGCAAFLMLLIMVTIVSMRKSSVGLSTELDFKQPGVEHFKAFIRGGAKDRAIDVVRLSTSRAYVSLVTECTSEDDEDTSHPLDTVQVRSLDECKAKCDVHYPHCNGFSLMMGSSFMLCDMKRTCNGIVFGKETPWDCMGSVQAANLQGVKQSIRGCGFRAMLPSSS